MNGTTSTPKNHRIRGASARFVLPLAVVASVLAGVGASAPPAAASTIPVVSAGGFHTCALMLGGNVLCWGNNSHGQLGNGTKTNSTVPVHVPGFGPPVIGIGTGVLHTCAVDQGEAAWCWGHGNSGQLGNGSSKDSTVPVHVQAPTGVLFTQISGGNDFTCALTTKGKIYCWGRNALGQLGNNTTTDSNVPVEVQGLTAKAIQVSAGGGHACAVLTTRQAMCWGWNVFGQLGNSSNTDSHVAVFVSEQFPVTTISAGGDHTCALLTLQVQCWGNNSVGELGDGTFTNENHPVNVVGLSNGVTQVSAGLEAHTCALVNTGSVVVQCWGEGHFGELGDGSLTSHKAPIPVTVLGFQGSPTGGGDGPVQVAAGGVFHACEVLAFGQVECWGGGGAGQLGNGTIEDVPHPSLVLGMAFGPQQVSEGGFFGCALTQGLGAKCWGTVAGDGDFNVHTSAVDVTGATSGVADVSAGSAQG